MFYLYFANPKLSKALFSLHPMWAFTSYAQHILYCLQISKRRSQPSLMWLHQFISTPSLYTRTSQSWTILFAFHWSHTTFFLNLLPTLQPSQGFLHIHSPVNSHHSFSYHMCHLCALLQKINDDSHLKNIKYANIKPI